MTDLLERTVLSPAPPHFLTERQLAARWNVVPRTIQRMVRDGELQPLLIRRTPRFAVVDVETYEARRLSSATLPSSAPAHASVATTQSTHRHRRQQVGRSPYVVCIAHRKGGVAKTTTTWYLARELARAGKRVLLRDCDPQAGLRDILRGHGVEDGRFSRRIALTDGDEPAPFTPDLELIDTPPLLDVSLPVLTHADALIIPVVPEFQAVRALGRMLRSIQATAADHPFLRVLGVLPTRIRARWPAHTLFLREIERMANEFGHPVLPPVPDSIAVMTFSLRGRLWQPVAQRILDAMEEDRRHG
jgi:cellulose biosynthesis protein BcsQ